MAGASSSDAHVLENLRIFASYSPAEACCARRRWKIRSRHSAARSRRLRRGDRVCRRVGVHRLGERAAKGLWARRRREAQPCVRHRLPPRLAPPRRRRCALIGRPQTADARAVCMCPWRCLRAITGRRCRPRAPDARASSGSRRPACRRRRHRARPVGGVCVCVRVRARRHRVPRLRGLARPRVVLTAAYPGPSPLRRPARPSTRAAGTSRLFQGAHRRHLPLRRRRHQVCRGRAAGGLAQPWRLAALAAAARAPRVQVLPQAARGAQRPRGQRVKGVRAQRHMGIGAGRLSSFYIGGHAGRGAPSVAGEPMPQMSDATRARRRTARSELDRHLCTRKRPARPPARPSVVVGRRAPPRASPPRRPGPAPRAQTTRPILLTRPSIVIVCLHPTPCRPLPLSGEPPLYVAVPPVLPHTTTRHHHHRPPQAYKLLCEDAETQARFFLSGEVKESTR